MDVAGDAAGAWSGAGCRGPAGASPCAAISGAGGRGRAGCPHPGRARVAQTRIKGERSLGLQRIEGSLSHPRGGGRNALPRRRPRVTLDAVPRGFIVSLVLLATSSCVDTSPDRVKLTAEVRDVELTVEEGLLAGAVTGRFALALSVGDLAGEAVTVEAPTPDLVTADERESLRRIDALSTPEFPLTVGADETVVVAFELTDGNTFAPDEADAFCAPLRISLTYRDSLADRPSLVESSPVTPDGCP